MHPTALCEARAAGDARSLAGTKYESDDHEDEERERRGARDVDGTRPQGWITQRLSAATR